MFCIAWLWLPAGWNSWWKNRLLSKVLLVFFWMFLVYLLSIMAAAWKRMGESIGHGVAACSSQNTVWFIPTCVALTRDERLERVGSRAILASSAGWEGNPELSGLWCVLARCVPAPPEHNLRTFPLLLHYGCEGGEREPGERKLLLSRWLSAGTYY